MTHKGIEIPGLVTTYYEVGPSKGYELGQIVWIPALYTNKDKVILDIDVSVDPTEQTLPAILSTVDNRKYKFPVKSLDLASNEHLFVTKGKMRPAIFLTEGFTRWPTNPSEQIFLCAPLYTLDKAKISQQFVLNVQAFKLPSKFYLRPFPLFRVEESIARFEYIQTVDIYALSPYKECGHPVTLSQEFFALLKIQLTRYLGGGLTREDSDIVNVYGDIILDEARKQGVKIP